MKKLLLDAERLIRLRGIPSRNSFAHRVLRHMYTHLRIMMESTNLNFSPPSLAPLTDDASSEDRPPNSTLMAVVPSSSFRVDESNLNDLDTLRHKPDEVGYYDIHLEVSGRWSNTMYPEMYGIPESLMTLHSQTISLVNEKPKLEAAGLGNPAISAALAQHTRTLEQQIWSWSMQTSGIPDGPERPESLVFQDTPFYDKPDTRLLVLAMREAVIIYFYRRVYNMSAMMQQDQVRKLLDYIQPYIEIGKYDQDYAMSIGWALFIAVCEAVTPELQERGLRCLEAVDRRGVFIETEEPSEVMQAVWEHRRRTGDLTFSWPDVMRQTRL
ncbi:hypothetical protein IMZ48_05250 [Candidatus Bathyarchaeota archaeon]|nr:hypothetical protein [Candidatus Bathyarchaeota archaeon]